MLQCEECGLIFDEEELASWNENRGEFWGMPCFETLQGCPNCFSGAVSEYHGEDLEGDEE